MEKSGAFFSQNITSVRVVTNGVFIYERDGRISQFIRNKRIAAVDHTSDKNIIIKDEAGKVLATIGKVPNTDLSTVYSNIVQGWTNFWLVAGKD